MATQHGDAMAPHGLLPAAAAEFTATTSIDFMVGSNLGDVAFSSSEQIQTIALFLSHLQLKPPKREYISECMDLIHQKPTCTPTDAIWVAACATLCGKSQWVCWCCRAKLPCQH